MPNLLQKASIVLTPTAYDDGKVLCVKPNENIYGSELVTNGDFSNGTTGWSSPDYNSTLSILNGQMKIVSTLSLGRVSQAITTEVGKKYLISATTTNIDSSTGIQIKVSNAANLDGATYSSEFNTTTNPLTITHRFIATATTTYIGSSQGSSVGQSALLDNVSVVEDSSGDFDFERGSAATRVNAQGLVENVQALSGNLVQNGSFSEIGAEEISNGNFSQQGSQLVTNGDFANWTNDNPDDYVVLNQNANNYVTESNGQLRMVSDNSATIAIRPEPTNMLTAGKIYKVSVDLTFTTGTIDISGNSFNTSGTKVFYLTAPASYLQISKASALDVLIDNVSVVEVGQDWGLGSGWSIGDDKALSDGTINTSISQSNVFTIGKSYKVTISVNDVVGSLDARFWMGTGGDKINISSQGDYTAYWKADGTDLLATTLSGNTATYSITNISVKEVGQDWDFGAGWEIADSEATKSGTDLSYLTQSSLTSVIGKTYNVKASITNVTTGNIRIDNFTSGTVYTSDTEINVIYTATTAGAFRFLGWAGFDGSVTNISVVEITDDTNLPRINYEGFSYQDVLGSEEIVNGGFDNGGANWPNFGGLAVFENSSVIFENNARIAQYNVGTLGKSYNIEINFSDISGNGIMILVGNGNSFVNYSVSDIVNNGYKITIEKESFLGTSHLFIYSQNSSTSATITNVSVKEVTQEVVPDSGCGHWLWEPQSTNLITYSEDIGSNGFSVIGTSIQSNVTASPDGTINADLQKEDSSNGSHFMYKDLNLSSGQTYAISVFAKSNGTNRNLRFGDGGVGWSSGFNVDFDLTNGTASSGGVIKSYGNGWYRCSVVGTTSATSSRLIVYNTLNASTNYQGDGSSGVFLYGFQIEQGSYATSYIPTSGTSVTRNQDVCNNGGAGTGLINSTEGVLYAEISALANDGTSRVISLSDSSDTNRVHLFYNVSDNTINVNYRVAGSSKAIMFFVLKDVTIMQKIAYRWKSGNFKLYINGVSRGTDTNTVMMPSGTMNQLAFNVGGGTSNFFGKTKALAVWKEALSDEELTLLTAPDPVAPTFTLDFDEIANQFTFSRASFGTIVNEQGLIETVSNIGPELITNGNFATSSNWNGVGSNGVNISNGSLNYSETPNGTNITQSSVVEVGKSYKVTFTISNYVKGGVLVVLGAGGVTQEISANGTFTLYGDASINTTLYIQARGASGTTLSVDNVSVKEVIEDDIPRIDYSTGTEAFLLEPQSTNLLPYSNDFSQWNLKQGTETLNYGISPDGTQNSTRIVFASSNLQFSQFITTGASTTGSIYVKGISGETINFGLDGSESLFTLNGNWQRFEKSGTSTSNKITINTFNSATARDIQVWGAQLEEQSFASSYIPTSGTTVTRVGETCVNATPEINSEEGVLYAEISALHDSGHRYISLNNSSITNRITIELYPNTETLVSRLTTNGVQKAFLVASNIVETNMNKIAVRYYLNNFSLWVNGNKVYEDLTDVPLPIGLDSLDFHQGNNSGYFYGNTKDLQYFNEALSDYQLAQLTTI